MDHIVYMFICKYIVFIGLRTSKFCQSWKPMGPSTDRCRGWRGAGRVGWHVRVADGAMDVLLSLFLTA